MFLYELCEEFPLYLSIEASLHTKKEELEKFNEKCKLIENDYTGILNESKDICAKFKYMATPFVNVTESNNSEIANVFLFLNFWLNYQLKDNQKSTISAKHFYDNLKRKDPDFDKENKLIDRIHVIEEKYLNKLVMLYNLYKNYNEVKAIIDDIKQPKKNCSNYPEQCIRLFEEANRNCSSDNINFCRALRTFKTKYEYMFKDTEYEKCKLHKALTLTNYEEPEDLDSFEDLDADPGDQAINAHIRNIIVATPFGIYFRRQIRRVKEKWTNLEYVNDNKSIFHNTEYQPLNENSNELRIPYY
ncbi:PIR Superfamily Protein [Plasmodium ovale wallikeri]|uniref:PIR Superfamily Protein n=1 Tax=Plasmodium ovale wallikeri TaxID=864142 RepID=A0A1A9ARJ1_PLAOA|nr:PIR Superfamily Protein [Plasmodium ovale wallikeri]SBT58831.1 PIR Superfamily Protein [Plasmodium ovale wallikeri]